MTRRLLRPGGGVLLGVLLIAGCGTRIPHDQVIGAAGGVPAAGSLGGPTGSAGGEADRAAGALADGSSSSPTTEVATRTSAPVGSGSGAGPAPVGSVAAKPNQGVARTSGQGAAPAAAGMATGHSATAAGTGSPASPAQGGEAPLPAAAGGVIRVASVSTLSGPVGSVLKSAIAPIRAWVAQVNARGGINGHKVEFIIAEDNSNPSQNRALHQELVEQKKVVAFLHEAAPLSGQASVSYLEEKKIPVVGSEGGSKWFNESPMYFPQVSSDIYTGFALAGSVASITLPQGKSKLGMIVCSEVAGCDSTHNPDAFKSFGMQVVSHDKVSLAQPDYTAQCLNARNAGAQVVDLGLDTQSILRAADNCASVGFKPVFVFTAQLSSNSMTGKPSLDGAIAGYTAAPYFLDTPAVAEYRAVMAQYAPGAPTEGSATMGWASAKMFEAAILAAPDPTTSAGLLDGLWSLKNADFGGVTAPRTFEKGAPNNAVHEQVCWWPAVISGGKWTSPNNGQRGCRK